MTNRLRRVGSICWHSTYLECKVDACPAAYDGLHPNALGEYQIAQAFSKTLCEDFQLGGSPLVWVMTLTANILPYWFFDSCAQHPDRHSNSHNLCSYKSPSHLQSARIYRSLGSGIWSTGLSDCAASCRIAWLDFLGNLHELFRYPSGIWRSTMGIQGPHHEWCWYFYSISMERLGICYYAWPNIQNWTWVGLDWPEASGNLNLPQKFEVQASLQTPRSPEQI